MIKSKVEIPKVWRSELGNVAVFLFLGVVSVIASKRYPALTIKGDLFHIGNTYVNLYLPLLWLLPAAYLFYVLYRIYNVKYYVDYRGIESCVGRLSVKQTINRVRYEDIRAIDIYQTIMDRMLDIGTLEIGTAAFSSAEISMEGIASPIEIKQMLEKERDGRLKAVSQKAGDGGTMARMSLNND